MKNNEVMSSQEKELHQHMTKDQIDTILSWSKWAWGLLVGTFVLGAAANYQMLTAKFNNEKRDARIEQLEYRTGASWNTAMIGDLTVYTHKSNGVVIMQEKDIRQLVDDIYRRYNSH